jgi:hypothetical protein
MHAALLVFLLCGPADLRDDAPADACEAGEMRARSCAAAEHYLRAGLRDGQVLHVMDCRVSPNA